MPHQVDDVFVRTMSGIELSRARTSGITPELPFTRKGLPRETRG